MNKKIKSFTSRAAIDWMPQKETPHGRSRKIWIDGVKEKLRMLGVGNWNVIVRDRIKWRDIVSGG